MNKCTNAEYARYIDGIKSVFSKHGIESYTMTTANESPMYTNTTNDDFDLRIFHFTVDKSKHNRQQTLEAVLDCVDSGYVRPDWEMIQSTGWERDNYIEFYMRLPEGSDYFEYEEPWWESMDDEEEETSVENKGKVVYEVDDDMDSWDEQNEYQKALNGGTLMTREEFIADPFYNGWDEEDDVSDPWPGDEADEEDDESPVASAATVDLINKELSQAGFSGKPYYIDERYEYRFYLICETNELASVRNAAINIAKNIGEVFLMEYDALKRKFKVAIGLPDDDDETEEVE